MATEPFHLMWKELSKSIDHASGNFCRPCTTTPNEVARDWLRPRNRAIDQFFYNVDPLDEQEVLEHGRSTQGSIIRVDPDPAEPLSFYSDAVEFCLDQRSRQVGALCIAGVGSSAIGAVGLARDVIRATGVPTAAIVSGYGVDDLMYEAMGGWFFLRETNRMEFVTEQMTHSLEAITGSAPLLTAIETCDSIGSGPDMVTAKSLLRQGRMPGLQWIVGHSKGNLVLAGALGELICEKTPIDLDHVNIVLFSAAVGLPPGVRNVYQFLGGLDMLGLMNSRATIRPRIVPNAMHHLNTKFWWHLDAVEQIRSII